MRAVVVIPTYMEYHNVGPLIERIRALPIPPLDLFFVDDGSPDGTGRYLEELKGKDSRIDVLHRPGKLGLGSAYREAYRTLLDKSYDGFLAMDADLSHPPERIPALLAASDRADLVIGSRYCPGGGTRNWSAFRKLLSRSANAISRSLLSLTVHDATAGFRFYSAKLIRALDRLDIRSGGYAYQIEMVYYTQCLGFRTCEIPILFEERTEAKSKMNHQEVWLAASTLYRLWRHRRRGRL